MPFQKGKSGNPGGKRKKDYPFTLANIKQHWELCNELIASGDLRDDEKIKAAQKMLEFECNYFYGRPSQQVDVTSDGAPVRAVVEINLSK